MLIDEFSYASPDDPLLRKLGIRCVELLTGLFANFIATVDNIDPEQRIWVLMDFMGQKTRLQVSANQLQLSK